MVKSNQPKEYQPPSITVTEYCDEEDFISDTINNQEIMDLYGKEATDFHFEQLVKGKNDNLKTSTEFKSESSHNFASSALVVVSLPRSQSMSSFESAMVEISSTSTSPSNEYTFSRYSSNRRTVSTCQPTKYKEGRLDTDVVSDVVPRHFKPELKESLKTYEDGKIAAQTENYYSKQESINPVLPKDTKSQRKQRPLAANFFNKPSKEHQKSSDKKDDTKSTKFVDKVVLVWNKKSASYQKKKMKFLRHGSKDFPIECNPSYEPIMAFETGV